MVGSDLKDIYAIAIGKRAYLLLTALFIPPVKEQNVSSMAYAFYLGTTSSSNLQRVAQHFITDPYF